MSLPSRLLGANPSIQVATLLSGSLTTPSAKQAFVPVAGYVSIATATVTSGGAPSVTFSSIPSSFTHLELRWTAANDRSTVAQDDLAMQFNGDTNSGNYKSQRQYSIGSSLSSDSVDGYGCIFGWCASAGRTNSNTFAMGIVTIPNYLSSNKKTTTGFSAMSNSPSNNAGIQNMAGFWGGTTAINEIKIYGINGNLLENSVFHLYGVK